jgi:hypothetical protein
VRDVLDQLLAQIFKDHAAAMKQVIVHSSRDADLPALYQPLEPSGDVHAVAEDVALFDHDVADVDANSAHLSPFWLTFIGSCKRLSDLDCAVNRVDTLANSASTLSPAVFAIRPRWPRWRWSSTARRADNVAIVASSLPCISRL